MIDYIIRMICCSGFFITIYYGILQNERMHKFNRFYLLSSGLFSLVVPLIKFKNENTALEQIENIVSQGTLYVNSTVEILNIQPGNNLSWETGLVIFYALTVIILFVRFVLFNQTLINKIKQCSLIHQDKATLALTSDNHPPYSFWNYIFVPKSDYENGLIEQTIIDHEYAHISQRHTLDILLIELLLVIIWFNPFFYLYKNAIRLNHEFLADEAVISRHKNTAHYQHLILRKTADTNGLIMTQSLSCPFNYLKTKKRLEMMTKMKITQRIILKQLSVVPLILVAVFFFSENTIAQGIKKTVIIENEVIAHNQTNSEEELQKAFDELLKPYIKEKNGKPVYYGIDADTQKKLIPLYEKMSESQKARQIVQYMPGLKKRIPSEVEYEKWKDPKTYGVWLDGKRISNDLLNNYKNTDIVLFDVSTLAKNAINYGKHVYQLNAWTNFNFNDYNKTLKENPYLVFWPTKKTN